MNQIEFEKNLTALLKKHRQLVAVFDEQNEGMRKLLRKWINWAENQKWDKQSRRLMDESRGFLP